MALSTSAIHVENGFRLRGQGVSRLDSLSNLVFGLALVLLVVPLEPPKNYTDLHEAVRGFLPAAICFALLLMVWHAHYTFSKRYGLEDKTTIVLNSTLLFLVLFYLQPLKFLFRTMVTEFVGHSPTGQFRSPGEVTELLLLYGVGFAAVYLLLATLYCNAWRQRDALELNGIERLITLSTVVDSVGVAGVGLLSCVLSLLLPARHAADAVYVYFLIALWKLVTGVYFGRKVRLLERLSEAPGL